jgi:hypothetical protein
MMLTEDQIKVLRELRNMGFAVVVFNPDELDGVSPDGVEDRLIEYGWDVIEMSSDKGMRDDI